MTENRRVYVVDERYWMVLTAEELLKWLTEAPRLVRYVNGEACSEVTHHKKERQ